MKAKYKKGQKIVSVGDFEKSSATFFRVIFGNHERTMHRSFLESWQYHTLHIFIRNDWVYEANQIEAQGRSVNCTNE